MDIIEIIAKALESISLKGITVVQGWYDENINDTHITFCELSDRSNNISDDEEEDIVHILQIDIWSKKDGKLVFSDNNAQLIPLSDDSNDYFKNNYFGNLLCTENFSEILILVGEETTPDSKGWYGENSLYVVAPADNKDDAINVAEKLSKRSVWLSECIWK